MLGAGSRACGAFGALPLCTRPASPKSASLATPIAGRALRVGFAATCGSGEIRVAVAGAGVCFDAAGAAAATALFVVDAIGAASLAAKVSFVTVGDVARAAGALAATAGAGLFVVADVVAVVLVVAAGTLAAAASFGVASATSFIVAGFTVSGPLYGAAGVA